MFPILVGTTSNLGFITEYFNYCEDAAATQNDPCAVAGPNSFRTASASSSSSSKYICLKCKSGYLDVVRLKRELQSNNRLEYSIVNYEYLTPPFIESPMAAYSAVQCLNLSGNNIF